MEETCMNPKGREIVLRTQPFGFFWSNLRNGFA